MPRQSHTTKLSGPARKPSASCMLEPLEEQYRRWLLAVEPVEGPVRASSVLLSLICLHIEPIVLLMAKKVDI